jgi:hypothetical protein
MAGRFARIQAKAIMQNRPGANTVKVPPKKNRLNSDL